MDSLAALKEYNRWRRGLDSRHDDAGPDPREIGQHIDAACAEIERLRAVESAAREMFRVRGRFNTQTATCRLGELLGERVVWPEKNRKCVEVATGMTPNNEVSGGR